MAYILTRYKGPGIKTPFLWAIDPLDNDPLTIMAKENQPVPKATVLMDLIAPTGKTPVLLDIGANIGGVSLNFAANGWQCYAIEASQKNASLLEESRKANDFDITIINQAVHENAGKIFFYQNGPFGFVKSDVHPSVPYEEIDALALNNWADTPLSSLRKIDLIKMNIEGSEPATMKGASAFLRRFNYPPIYAELNALALFPQGETVYSAFNTFTGYGYTPYKIINGGLYEYDPAMFQTEIYADYFFIKHLTPELEKRVKGPFTRSESDTVESIIKDLTDPEEVYVIATCYGLSAYPRLSCIPEIAYQLARVKYTAHSSPMQKASAWIATHDNVAWLKEAKMQYAPVIESYNKGLAPLVIPVKRGLRKLFQFIGAPLVEALNQYHSHLAAQFENEALHARMTLDEIRRVETRLRAEIAEVRQSEADLRIKNNDLTAIIKMLMHPRTTVPVSDGRRAYTAVLNKQDTDPITASLCSGGMGDIEKGLADLSPDRDKKYFLDLGGNVGTFSLYMGACGWHGCAFEASAHNAKLLQDSIILNDYSITVFNKAVSDYTGSLYFSSNGPWGIVVTDPASGENHEALPCVALDDMLDTAFKEVTHVDLIKIDIEGSEPAALRGMKGFLARYAYPPIYMEINAFTLSLFQETPLSLLTLAGEQGYTAYTINNGDELSPLDYMHLPQETVYNVLLLKDIPPDLPYRIPR